MLDAYIIQKRQRDRAERAKRDRASWGNQPRIDYSGARQAWEDHNRTRDPEPSGQVPDGHVPDFTL